MQWIVLFASGDNGERDGMCTSTLSSNHKRPTWNLIVQCLILVWKSKVSLCSWARANEPPTRINLTFLWGYDAGFQRVAQSIREDKASFGFIRGPFKFYVLK